MPSPRPRILLAGLDPILELGMARTLVAGGAVVVQAACEDDAALVRNAAAERPNGIVVGGAARPGGLATRLRAAAPEATVVLWPTDTDAVAVMTPGDPSPRLLPVTSAEELFKELFGQETEGETCRPT